MAKKMRRMLAAALALCMLMSACPLQALAAEEDVVESTETSPEGLTTNVTTTTTTETDGAGNTTVTIKIEKETNGTTEDGVTVNREETSTESTITNENGNVIGEVWSEGGSEKKEWTEEDTGDEEGQPEVSVELKPGEKTQNSASTSTTTGDVATGEDDKEYDYTITTETDRTVNADTSDIKITVNDSDTGLVGDEDLELEGLAPVYDETDDEVRGSDGKILDSHGKEDVFDRNYLSTNSKYTDTENWEMPEGADLRYVGTGEHGKFYTAKVYVTYEKDEEGNTVYDENGNPVIAAITKTDGTPITIDGEVATELVEGVSLVPVYDDYNGSRPKTFMLMDEKGNKFYGYCCDLDTSAKEGSWYSISNLEDSDYYGSEEAEAHIRSIVMNGYWGTSDIPKEDGTYETGSLEGIKQKLKEAINNGEMENRVITVETTDEEGNTVTESKTMLELIDDMTEGEALLATQSAIWSYSNGHYNALNGQDGSVLVDPDGYKWNHNPNIDSKAGEALDDFGSARVDFLYEWLIGLETEEDSTIVINEKNFIDGVSLTVGDKVSGHESNTDDDTENDVYNANLNFKLAFVPGENDDLLVQITYTDLDGNDVNVVKRLAGENDEGEDYETITPEEDGSYVLKDLVLSENEDFNFDLRLEGTQYLEQGVYIYAPVGGRDISQTFVGIAEGNRNVDVSANMTVKFEVDEDNHIVAERRWYDEGDPVYPPAPPADPVDPTPDPEEPVVHRLGVEEEPTVEIPEEEVPLANAPTTGDNTGLWAAVILMAAFALCAVNVFTKKRQHETF